MKNRILSLLPLLVLFVTLSSSCGKEEEEIPSYVGSWWKTETITQEGVTLQARSTVTFTESTFSELVEILFSGKYINLVKVSGTMTANASQMNCTLNTIGVTSYSISGMPTGTLINYNEGDTEFNDLLTQAELEKNFTAQYSVDGKQLTLDGSVYTKK